MYVFVSFRYFSILGCCRVVIVVDTSDIVFDTLSFGIGETPYSRVTLQVFDLCLIL